MPIPVDTEISHASLWIGNADSSQALNNWVEENYPDDEEQPAWTIFWRGFGIRWFDHDFMQASTLDATREIVDVLETAFGQETPRLRAAFDRALRENWGDALPFKANALILLFAFDYPNNAEKSVEAHSEAGVTMRFAASVPYECRKRNYPTDREFPLEMQ